MVETKVSCLRVALPIQIKVVPPEDLAREPKVAVNCDLPHEFFGLEPVLQMGVMEAVERAIDGNSENISEIDQRKDQSNFYAALVRSIEEKGPLGIPVAITCKIQPNGIPEIEATLNVTPIKTLIGNDLASIALLLAKTFVQKVGVNIYMREQRYGKQVAGTASRAIH